MNKKSFEKIRQNFDVLRMQIDQLREPIPPRRTYRTQTYTFVLSKQGKNIRTDWSNVPEESHFKVENKKRDSAYNNCFLLSRRVLQKVWSDTAGTVNLPVVGAVGGGDVS